MLGLIDFSLAPGHSADYFSLLPANSTRPLSRRLPRPPQHLARRRPKQSLYSPVEAPLNAASAAAKLKPRVVCFMNLKNQGAGMPDGGLFTKDHISTATDEPPPGQAPARGAHRVQAPARRRGPLQKRNRYPTTGTRYNQVLVTNYRDFVLLAADDSAGGAVGTETYPPGRQREGVLGRSRLIRNRRPSSTASG